jgi:hypothetical protein
MSDHRHHADPIAMRLAAALLALSHKHPEAPQDINDLLLYVPGLRGAVPLAHPIAQAPTHNPEQQFHVFCPEQGGWQTGVFFEGRWVDYATLSVELEPTHFIHVLPDPEAP